MQFDITALTITLMVGASTILGFEAILHYLFDKGLLGVLKLRKGKEQSLTLVMLFVFAFGLGVIVEDLSQKYIDSDDFPFKTRPSEYLPLSWVQRLGLPSADDDRAVTLVSYFENASPGQLAKDLAANHAFQISAVNGAELPPNKEVAEKVEDWILKQHCKLGDSDCVNKKQIENASRTLYYYAKNTAYSHPQTYDDLKRVEDRLRFVRSVSMIAFIYLFGTAVVILPFGVWKLLTWFVFLKIGWIAKLRKWIRSSKPKRKPIMARWLIKVYRIQWRWSALGVVAVFFGVYFFTIWAYAREADAFNRRAFGYLSTMLVTEQRKADVVKEQQSNEKTNSRDSRTGIPTTPPKGVR